ncbi:MAG TPA: protein kinase [Vicinamibacteria bacterium]|nr:protein kinase [Vicinamibacteria bacterium]
MSLPAGHSLGPYRILAPLGAGGMGEVYRARDTRLDREVAVKVLPERVSGDHEALARFEREAKAVAALSHPNILAIHDFGTQEGASYAVMELLEGETLRERLAHGALPPRKAVEYAVQIANALAAAHEKGIVHRDLKPENVLVTRDGRIKVLDFGLATQRPTATAGLTDSPTVSRFTDPGVVLGTVGYMSPEQVRGGRADHRTDIFALGVVLYEMLTGLRPFERETAAETMTAILKEDVPELSATVRQIPVSLDRLLRRCLEKSPEERLQSARDVAIALEAFSGSDSSRAPPATAWPRRANRALLGAALLLAGTAIGFVGGRRAGTQRTVAEPSLPRYSALTFRRGFVGRARFAADGQTVVYSAIWDSEPMRVFSQRVEGSASSASPMVEGSLFSLSRSGELAVALRPRLEELIVRGTLARMPLAGGAPRELLEDVNEAEWSPDGQLAVVRSAGGRSRLELPVGRVLYETAGWLASPRFSPAGDAIAFHEHPLHWDDRGWPSLVDLKTGARRNLSREYTSLQGLAWRPDGREVCFAVSSTVDCVDVAKGTARHVLREAQRLVLHDIAADGRLLASAYSLRGALVASAGGPEVDLSWSTFSLPMDIANAGDRVLSESLDYGIYLSGFDRSAPVRLGDGIPTGLSPDGRHVLAIVPGVPTQLAILPAGAGETHTLPRGALTNHTWAVWVPDGRRIVVSGSEEGHGSRLYLQEVQGGDPRPITGEGVRLAPYLSRVVSPDGRWVAAVGPDQVPTLYPIEGGDPRPLAVLGSDLLPVGWTDRPDVLFARARAFARICPVFRIDLKSGRRQIWKELGTSDRAGAPWVTNVQVSPDGRRYAYSYGRMDHDLFVISGALGGDGESSH